MASAVLAFVVASLVQAISAGQMQSADAIQNLRGLTLAETLMEEILAKPYDDPDPAAAAVGPESGETSRALFDNSDDYHNYSEAAGALADAAGQLYPQQYQRFTRQVTCTYTSVTIAGLGGGVALPGLNITVTVTATSNGRSWSVTRFRPEPSS